MNEWDSRAEAWQARKHTTTIRRSRKGGDNSRTYRRGLAPVQGSMLGSPAWVDAVGADVATAILHDLRGAHALILGTSGLDLAKLVDRYADVLDCPPLLGTEGDSKAYKQIIDVRKASPGADLFDLIAVTAHRDDMTSWAETQQARRAFKTAHVVENKLDWPDRLTAGTARSRKSENDQAGPRVPGSDGKLHRTGRLYGASFKRNGKRYVRRSTTIAPDQYGWVTMPRVAWWPATWYGLNTVSTYGTRAGWSRLAGSWRVSPGVKLVKSACDGPITTTVLDVEHDPTADPNERVFIGHRSVRRGKATADLVKAGKHLGAFKLANVEQVRHFATLVEPNTLATVDFGPFEPGHDNIFGTVSRSAGGRWSLSITLADGHKVRHQPRGVAAAVEYLTRYLT